MSGGVIIQNIIFIIENMMYYISILILSITLLGAKSKPKMVVVSFSFYIFSLVVVCCRNYIMFLGNIVAVMDNIIFRYTHTLDSKCFICKIKFGKYIYQDDSSYTTFYIFGQYVSDSVLVFLCFCIWLYWIDWKYCLNALLHFNFLHRYQHEDNPYH